MNYWGRLFKQGQPLQRYHLLSKNPMMPATRDADAADHHETGSGARLSRNGLGQSET